MPPTNSALGPWPAAIGKKDNAVVAVAAESGIHKWWNVSYDADSLEYPKLRLYLKSSTTMIALSINNPKAMIIPVIEVWWSGRSISLQPKKTKDTENGKSVCDRMFNDGLVERTLDNGAIVYIGKQLTGEELVMEFERHNAERR